MVDDKDRMGAKLREKERGEEDLFFGERDRALLEKLRANRTAAEIQQIRELCHMRCPKCGARLGTVTQHGVTVDECPACHGTFLEQGELEAVASRERDSWLGCFFFQPKR